MEMNKTYDIPDNALTQKYDLLKELGDCYAAVNDYARAQENYEQAATLAPDEAGPYVGLGVIALQQGRLDDAELAFKVARRLDTDNSRAYCGLAMVYQQKKQYQQALDYYLKCLENDSDNLSALLGLFQTSCQMGSFSKVIYYLELYLNAHPVDTSVMFCLATLYVREGKLSESRRLLADVLTFDPENTDAANLLEEVEHKLAQASQAGNKQ